MTALSRSPHFGTMPPQDYAQFQRLLSKAPLLGNQGPALTQDNLATGYWGEATHQFTVRHRLPGTDLYFVIPNPLNPIGATEYRLLSGHTLRNNFSLVKRPTSYLC